MKLFERRKPETVEELTERVRLWSTIVILPAHDAVEVAKRLASVDVLSNGRLTAGVGVGGREHDYRAIGGRFDHRWARMDEQVAVMRRIWAGDPPFDGADPVGPPPVQAGGPPLIAGVMVSTFPYALDVVAKVTSIRDFFVTLFFVTLGMTIPVPTWNFLLWMLIFSAFVVGSRLITVFPVLYHMRLGHRVSLRASIDELDVSAIARKSGGGGHRQAAGFSSEASIEEITEFVRREFAAARS